jgi:hypothetical protein
MSDLRDFTGKNRNFTGTIGEKISSGTTGQRNTTAYGAGTIRFNTTTNLMEYYEGTDWKAIDAPPVITSFSIDDPEQSTITQGRVNISGGGTVQISVNGSLFDTTGASVTFEGSGETLSSVSITRNSANLLTATFTESDFDSANFPYSLKVTNGSGLSAQLTDAIIADNAPAFTNAADTIGTVNNGQRASGSFTANDLCGATDADGDTITYSVVVGALPTGFTLNTSTGVITWSSVAAVGSDTTTTFTIRAATTFGQTDRQFKITVKAPTVETFSSTGAFTFSVPSGVSSVEVLAIAGGGSGGCQVGGGGGAGGMVEHSTYPVSPGGSVTGNIGVGGTGFQIGDGGGNIATNGTNTTFGNITAIGGGAGGNHTGPQPQSGKPGGSGGGGGSSGGNQPGGTGTQGPSGGGSGYGNNGGHGHPSWSGGGGGGAGGSGQNAPNGSRGGDGGSGRSNSISGTSVTYAGGGGGGADSGNSSGGPGGGGNGTSPGTTAGDGTDGLGAGGGGTRDNNTNAGDGGNGVVIVKY